jgi:hypothetical protein
MPKGVPEVSWEKDVEITEASKTYKLHLTLFKSRLNVEDTEGNKIAIDKRDGKIAIQKWGNVEFHRDNQQS